jgi:hypothetical protein
VFLLPGMIMSWRNFSLPISYNSTDAPDSAIIVLSASGNTPVESSYLYIDDLAFAGGNAGVEEQSLKAGLTIFPNPVVTDKLMVDFKNRTIAASHIDILDLAGKVVLKADFRTRNSPLSIEVSSLPQGEYLLRAVTPEGTFGGKFTRR